jgi:hypothetical protein
MTAPQPGDRVRVTYEGVWTGPCHVQVFVSRGDSDLHCAVPADATVEVLPPPVYANHDTTEFQPRDVVRDAEGDVFVRGGASGWWALDEFEWRRHSIAIPPLTLLVREGQVIA